MTKEELIEKVKSIQDLKKDYKIIYEVLDELQIKYKKTTCGKCRQDYLNIIKEELGMIDNAAEESEFNNTEREWKWVYMRDRAYCWNRPDGSRVIINRNTPQDIIEEFVKEHRGFYKRININ